MKKVAITLFIAAATVAAPCAYGQMTDTESATISATVIAALSVSKDQDLAFGDLPQNSSSTVEVTDAGAVKFTVGGEPNKNVTFTLTSPANLTNGANNLPFVEDVQVNTTDAPGTAAALTDGATEALSGTGALFVYLGGTVTAAPAQATGAYSGTFTLQVDY